MQFKSFFVSLLLSTAALAADADDGSKGAKPVVLVATSAAVPAAASATSSKPMTMMASAAASSKPMTMPMASSKAMTMSMASSKATAMSTVKAASAASSTKMSMAMSMATKPTTMAMVSMTKAASSSKAMMTSAMGMATTRTTTMHRMTLATECANLLKLEKLVALVANETALQKEAKNDATKVTELKAEASKAAIELKTLQANTTLIAACAKLAAEQKLIMQCKQELKLEKIVMLAGNATAMAMETKNNATKAAQIQAQASQAAAQVAMFQKNATLVQFCAMQATMTMCRRTVTLIEIIILVRNPTALENATKGNATAKAMMITKANTALTEVTVLMANETMMTQCAMMMPNFNMVTQALRNSTGSTTLTGNSTNTGSTSSSTSSGTVHVNAAPVQSGITALLGSVFVMACGLLLL